MLAGGEPEEAALERKEPSWEAWGVFLGRGRAKGKCC